MDGFVDIGHRTLFQCLGVHHSHGSCQIALAHDCTDDDHLVKRGVLFIQHNLEISVSHLHFLGLETNIGDGQLGIGIGLQGEVAVDVGNGAFGGARNRDTGTNDRLCGLVNHITFNSGQLRHRVERCAYDNNE